MIRRLFLRAEQGLGDVLMALGAAKALYLRGHRINLYTNREYASIVSLCPYIGSVDHFSPSHHPGNYIHLGKLEHAIASMHQIDSYLYEIMEYTEPDPVKKSIDLSIPESPKVKAWVETLPPGPRVLIHPAMGNQNRTYMNWQGVVDLLIKRGITPISIGRTSDYKSVQSLKGVYSGVNQFSLLETVDLIRKCDCLVASDSGPIHLAGASRTPIVGLFTTVKGAYRMPFRDAGCKGIVIQGACASAGCYELLQDPATRKEAVEPGEWTGTFCPKGTYGCLGIPPSKIVDAVLETLKSG